MKKVQCLNCGSYKVTKAQPASGLEFLLVAGLLWAMVLSAVILGVALSSRWSSALVVSLICVLGTGLVIPPVLRRSCGEGPARCFACDECGYYWQQAPEETQDEPVGQPIPATHGAH